MVSSPTPLDAASANLLISAATSLASEDPAAAQARWDALGGDDELLDAEVAKYRAALGALSQRLRDLGGDASSRGGSDDGGDGGAGGAGGGSGIDGVEVSRKKVCWHQFLLLALSCVTLMGLIAMHCASGYCDGASEGNEKGN